MRELHRDINIGLIFSVIGHFVLLLIIAMPSRPSVFEQPIVYSVSIEGGKQLGGIDQLAKDNKPKEMAPPKNVKDKPAPPPPVAKDTKPETKDDATVDKNTKDAEVSLADEAAKKKAEEEAKKKAEAERIQKEKDAAKKKADDAKKKADEAKKKAEAEKAAKAKAEADLNKRLQQAVQRYTGDSVNAGGQGFGAARLGGTGMGGGVVRPPEFFKYRDEFMAYIKSGWKWHDTNAALIAQVEIRIEPDGKITKATLVAGSGNSVFDDSVMRAIQKASPLPPPPPSVYNFFKLVRVTFDPRE